MLRKFSEFIYRISTGRVTLIAVGIFIALMIFVLPDQAQQAEAYAGEAGSPDLSFYYTLEDLYSMAREYGRDGRLAYIQARLTFDVIFPILFTTFFLTTISWTFKQIFREDNKKRVLNLFPFFGLLFDYSENITTSIVMAKYPQIISAATLAPIFTMLKWIFVSLNFVLLIYGLIAFTISKLRKKEQKNIKDRILPDDKHAE